MRAVRSRPLSEYHHNRLRRLWASLGWRRARESWRIFAENRLAVLGLVLIGLYALMASAHPVLMATVWPKGMYDPQVGYDQDVVMNPSPPSARHLLGTDVMSRDVLSMLLAATTHTFVVAITAAVTTAIFGTTVGAVSAYHGGVVDAFFTHLADALLLLPAPIFMVIVGRWSPHIGPVTFGAIYGLLQGLGGAAVVLRSQALKVMAKPFIAAARVAGGGAGHILRTHVVPHMLPLAAVYMMMSVTGAVVADGFSSFFGLTSVRLNWGSMIYSGLTFMIVNPRIPWNVLIPPSVALSLFAGAFYFVARGLHQVADPRLRLR